MSAPRGEDTAALDAKHPGGREHLGRLPEGDVKLLAGTVGLYRLRVGDWRAIFRRDDQEHVITVAQVLPRGGAYKDL